MTRTLNLRFAFLLTACLLVFSSVVSALPEEHKQAIDRNSVHYVIPHEGSDGSCTSSGIILSGGSPVEKAYNFLLGADTELKPYQVAGIVGNLYAESGVLPKRKQGTPPTYQATIDDIKESIRQGGAYGIGIAQWTSAGRQQNLLNKADELGGDPLTLEVQLPFLLDELKGDTLTQIKAAEDVRQATWIFLVFFERPAATSGYEFNPVQATSGSAKEELDKRAGFAEQVTSGLGVDSGDPTNPSPSPCAKDDTGDGEIVSVDGFTFPLKITRATMLAGSPSVWCYKSTDNCHHDYNAADMFAPTGTTVVAARGGKVISAKDHDDSSVGSRVTILGDDNVLYYYAHMGDGTIAVHDNQKINGGDKIGEVGTRTDAMGTDTHLHIDALPGDKYQFRPECSGSSCSGYPFINIQATLSEVFKSVK